MSIPGPTCAPYVLGKLIGHNPKDVVAHSYARFLTCRRTGTCAIGFAKLIDDYGWHAIGGYMDNPPTIKEWLSWPMAPGKYLLGVKEHAIGAIVHHGGGVTLMDNGLMYKYHTGGDDRSRRHGGMKVRRCWKLVLGDGPYAWMAELMKLRNIPEIIKMLGAPGVRWEIQLHRKRRNGKRLHDLERVYVNEPHLPGR